MGKGLLIIILGGIGIFGWINFNNNNRITQGTELVAKRFCDIKARNSSNATVELLLTELAKDNDYRETSSVTKNMFDGEVTYTVTDTLIGADSLVKINVQANYLNSVKSTTVVAWLPSSGYEPGFVKASINTNNDVLGLGTLTIDGRDHGRIQITGKRPIAAADCICTPVCRHLPDHIACRDLDGHCGRGPTRRTHSAPYFSRGQSGVGKFGSQCSQHPFGGGVTLAGRYVQRHDQRVTDPAR